MVQAERGLDPADVAIVGIRSRPDLAPVVAGWIWRQFLEWDGYSLQQTEAIVAASVGVSGPPQCFVLLVQGEPVGTASLALSDLDERPDLTPWLAGVFVVPEWRGRGLARQLVATVELACVDAGIPAAWLYTNTAEALYAKAGWRAVEQVEREGKPPVVVMQKRFDTP